jgi:hypothetical protein
LALASPTKNEPVTAELDADQKRGSRGLQQESVLREPQPRWRRPRPLPRLPSPRRPPPRQPSTRRSTWAIWIGKHFCVHPLSDGFLVARSTAGVQSSLTLAHCCVGAAHPPVNRVREATEASLFELFSQVRSTGRTGISCSRRHHCCSSISHPCIAAGRIRFARRVTEVSHSCHAIRFSGCQTVDHA